MKQLEKVIKKNGFEFRQIKETETGFIYSQHLPEMGNKIIAYEVFKKKENTQYDCISFPSAEAFGLLAWTYPNLQDAENRLLTFNSKATDSH